MAQGLRRGLTIAQIADELGVVKSTVCYHARRLGIPADEAFARRYDWVEIQRYYDEGHSIRECARHFGFCRESWHRAARAGLLRSRPAEAPIETYLVAGRRTNRSHLKERLLQAGLKENRCERCGLREWHGRPLAMALHHVNGDGLDNRLSNIELLCPNCHAQTPNYGGRNRGARQARRAERVLRAAGARPLNSIGSRALPVVGTAS